MIWHLKSLNLKTILRPSIVGGMPLKHTHVVPSLNFKCTPRVDIYILFEMLPQCHKPNSTCGFFLCKFLHVKCQKLAKALSKIHTMERDFGCPNTKNIAGPVRGRVCMWLAVVVNRCNNNRWWGEQPLTLTSTCTRNNTTTCSPCIHALGDTLQLLFFQLPRLEISVLAINTHTIRAKLTTIAHVKKRTGNSRLTPWTVWQALVSPPSNQPSLPFDRRVWHLPCPRIHCRCHRIDYANYPFRDSASTPRVSLGNLNQNSKLLIHQQFNPEVTFSESSLIVAISNPGAPISWISVTASLLPSLDSSRIPLSTFTAEACIVSMDAFSPLAASRRPHSLKLSC